ncbi:MAG: hypothetical protein ABIG84_08170 [archaeon]
MTNILNTIQKRMQALIKKIPPELSLSLSILFSMLSGYLYLIDNMIAAALTLSLSSYFATHAKDNTAGQQKPIRPQSKQVTDRIRDAFIFTGITLNPNIPLNIGLITMAAVIFVPHLISLRQTLSKQKIDPKISRADIDMILITSTMIATFIRPALCYSLLLITALCIGSFIEMQFRTYKDRSKRK